MVPGRSDLAAEVGPRQQRGLVAKLVPEKLPATLEPHQVTRTGREDDRAAPGVVAVDRLVRDQGLESLHRLLRELEQPARLGDAELPGEHFDVRLEPRQHEPAVPTACAPSDHVPLEHGGVDAAPREHAGGGEAGVPAADDGHVRPIPRYGDGQAGRGRCCLGPEAALDHRRLA
jgi:hypothetical protein